MPPNMNTATNTSASFFIFFTPHTQARGAMLTFLLLDDPMPTLVNISPDTCQSDSLCQMTVITRFMPLGIEISNATLTTARGRTVPLNTPTSLVYSNTEPCLSRLCTKLSFDIQTPAENPDGADVSGLATIHVCALGLCVHATFNYVAVGVPVVELVMPTVAYSHAPTIVELHVVNFPPIQVSATLVQSS